MTDLADWTQQEAWEEAQSQVVFAMGAINLGIVAVVDAVVLLLRTTGWVGVGIASPEHWLQWKANVSRRRAQGLVQVARRVDDLPVCWAAFREGRITEDAIVRIARKCPPERDAELARWAVEMTISQLDRILRSLPDVRRADEPPRLEPERRLDRWTIDGGWVEGRFTLPPDEAALLDVALDAARSAEWRDRKDLAADAELGPAEAKSVSHVDALVRLLSEGLDGMDAHFRRTGHRGDRHQVILHREVGPDGRCGPPSFHQGDAIPGTIARYLACDAATLVQHAREGRLVGITPTERHPNRRLRRYLERRDGGCAHPLCLQRRFLHAHHLVHWEDGGPTTPENLLCLCPMHHRALHMGEYTIEGDPEAGAVVIRDRWGRPIAPPELGATPLPTPANTSYVQPLGERLSARDFFWN